MYKIAAAAIAVLLAAAVLYAVGYKHARSKCEAEWLAAQNAILEKQGEIQKEYERALNESRKKQSAILADFSNARDALDGLRYAVENGGNLSNTECANANNNAAGELLVECGERLVEVAKAADLHASDALTCVSAWRAVENVK